LINIKSFVWIDYEEDRLYWVDSKLHRLSSSNLQGEDRSNILQQHDKLRFPQGIALLFEKGN